MATCIDETNEQLVTIVTELMYKNAVVQRGQSDEMSDCLSCSIGDNRDKVN